MDMHTLRKIRKQVSKSSEIIRDNNKDLNLTKSMKSQWPDGNPTAVENNKVANKIIEDKIGKIRRELQEILKNTEIIGLFGDMGIDFSKRYRTLRPDDFKDANEDLNKLCAHIKDEIDSQRNEEIKEKSHYINLIIAILTVSVGLSTAITAGKVLLENSLSFYLGLGLFLLAIPIYFVIFNKNTTEKMYIFLYVIAVVVIGVLLFFANKYHEPSENYDLNIKLDNLTTELRGINSVLNEIKNKDFNNTVIVKFDSNTRIQNTSAS